MNILAVWIRLEYVYIHVWRLSHLKTVSFEFSLGEQSCWRTARELLLLVGILNHHHSFGIGRVARVCVHTLISCAPPWVLFWFLLFLSLPFDCVCVHLRGYAPSQSFRAHLWPFYTVASRVSCRFVGPLASCYCLVAYLICTCLLESADLRISLPLLRCFHIQRCTYIAPLLWRFICIVVSAKRKALHRVNSTAVLVAVSLFDTTVISNGFQSWITVWIPYSFGFFSVPAFQFFFGVLSCSWSHELDWLPCFTPVFLTKRA